MNNSGLLMNNDETDNKFDWGESANVKNTVPSIFRSGQVVSICGMTNPSLRATDETKSY